MGGTRRSTNVGGGVAQHVAWITDCTGWEWRWITMATLGSPGEVWRPTYDWTRGVCYKSDRGFPGGSTQRG